jgi:hypothetical protein
MLPLNCKIRRNTACNTPQPGAHGHTFALWARKWLGTGARPFALPIELAQKQIVH